MNKRNENFNRTLILTLLLVFVLIASCVILFVPRPETPAVPTSPLPLPPRTLTPVRATATRSPSPIPMTPTAMAVPAAVKVSWSYLVQQCPPSRDKITNLSLDWRQFDQNLSSGSAFDAFTFHLNVSGYVEVNRYPANNSQLIGYSRIQIEPNYLNVIPLSVLSRDQVKLISGVVFVIECPYGKYFFDNSHVTYEGEAYP